MASQFWVESAQRKAGDRFVIGSSENGPATWEPRADPGMLICETSGLGKHTIINQVIAASAFMGRRVILIDRVKWGLEQRELFESISEMAFGEPSAVPLLERLRTEALDQVTIVYKYAWSTRDIDPETAARRDQEIELLNDLVATKGGGGLLVVVTTETDGAIKTRLPAFTPMTITVPMRTQYGGPTEGVVAFSSAENAVPTIALLAPFNSLNGLSLLGR